MRTTEFVNGEIYHVFNRGVDKRDIVLDKNDSNRFIQGLFDFNVIEPIGSIYESSFKDSKKSKKLVNIICYCLNNNHYHLLIEQLEDRGIEKLLHRQGMGYSKYFNSKYKRSGALWQGKFKAIHVAENEYLLHLSVYVNLNHLAHQLGHRVSKLVRTSWGEYMGKSDLKLCQPSIILEQFKNKEEYKNFAEETIEFIKDKKLEDKELSSLLLE